MPAIYITEPDAINTTIVRERLAATYQIIEGDTTFSGAVESDAAVLLIRSATTISSNIKTYFPSIRHIVRVGVGVDNIDVEYCKHAGIAIYNAPGANADAVSDYVVGMMFYALRKLHFLEYSVIESWFRC